MKLFIKLQEHLKFFGVYKSPTQQKYLVNSRNVQALLILVFLLLIAGSYLLFEAETIEDKAYSFFLSDTIFFAVIIFMNLIIKMAAIFELIEILENIIQKRE